MPSTPLPPGARRTARRGAHATRLAALALAPCAAALALPAQPPGAAGAPAAPGRPPAVAPRASRLPPDADSVAPPPTTFPDGTRRVEGRVVRGDTRAGAGVGGAWVTLHRVAADAAGPLDSLRTGADGGFAFRFRPAGSADAIYFVSTMHDGVAYFTRPLSTPLTRGDDAELVVFDTTSRPLPITVRGRHLVVSTADSTGARTVVEVYELSNDTSLTLVAGPDSARGVWSVAVPPRATGLRVVRGDVPPEALVPVGGRAVLLAPFAPGLKQVGFSYTVGPDDFPLALQVERPTTVLEVLIGDAAGSATGARLAPVEPASLDGQTYRRFLSQDVREGATVTVTVPAVAARVERYVVPALLAVIGVGMLGALLRATTRRPAPTAALVGAPPAHAPRTLAEDDEQARLARAIAALDETFARAGDPTPEARAEYERQRGELKTALARALAGTAGDH